MKDVLKKSNKHFYGKKQTYPKLPDVVGCKSPTKWGPPAKPEVVEKSEWVEKLGGY